VLWYLVSENRPKRRRKIFAVEKIVCLMRDTCRRPRIYEALLWSCCN